MNRSMKAVGIVAAVIFAGAMCGCAAHEDEDAISLSDTPAAVQATAKSVAGDNKIGDVGKEDEDGKVAYEVEYNVGSVEHAVVISAAGDIVQQSQDVDWAVVPGPVTDAAKKAHADGKLGEAELITASGKSYYEVETTVGSDLHEMKINADGSVISDKIANPEKDEKPEAGEGGEKKD
jgi:uncharacterized membrane protein YkoI